MLKPLLRPLVALTLAAFMTSESSCRAGADGTRVGSLVDLDRLAFQRCVKEPLVNDSLDMAAAYVPNPEARCVLWPSAFGDVSAFAGLVQARGSQSSAMLYQKPAQGLPPTDIVVRLVGGPAGQIAPKQSDQPYASLALSGASVVSLGYSGTAYRSNYPEPDYRDACAETSAYLRQLRARNRDARLHLVGESLGGRIAACAAQEVKDVKLSSIVLVSPLAWSPNDAMDNFRRMISAQGKDTLLTLRTRDADGKPHWRNVSSLDVFSSFFDVRARAIDLPALLTTISDVPITIIYGDRDPIIGVPSLRVIDQPNVKVVECAGAGHALLDEGFPPQAEHALVSAIIEKRVR